jgi:signal transduction histidine kinase
MRLRPDGGSELITKIQGLSSNLVEAIVDDNSGGLWVATAGGLDHFGAPNVVRFTTSEGLSGDLVTAVCSARDGSIWAGTAGKGINRLRGRQVEAYSTEAGLPSATVTGLVEDMRGRLWVATTLGLAYFDGRRFTRIAAENGALDSISVLASDGSNLWAIDRAHRILKVSNPGLPDQKIECPFPSAGAVYRFAVAPGGALWIGRLDGLVSRADGSMSNAKQKGGSASDPLNTLFFDAKGDLWACSSHRLYRMSPAGWSLWTPENGLPQDVLYGAVEAEGRIWLVAAAAIYEFLPEQGKTGASVRHEIFLGTTARGASPRIAAGAGALWLASDDGLGRFDIATVSRPGAPLTVIVESVVADGKVLPMSTRARPEFLASNVQVEFSAPGAATRSYPVEFRYRLEPLDKSWSPAGTERTAHFFNLGPAIYNFCVAVADGTLLSTSCSEFRVLPRFYQAWWFLPACSLVAAAAGAAAYRARMRQLRDRFELILQERMRVARDLHDTILQGFSGVAFQLDAASKLLDRNPDRARQSLTKALEQADRSLLEARETISYLRLTALESGLVGAIKEIGEYLTQEQHIRFSLEVEGPVDDIRRDVEATLYLTTREAIRNAVRHASPSSIHVSLTRNHSGLEILVKDDGSGFKVSPDQAPTKWGLRGATERASTIGAKLTVTSAVGRGAEIRITVPRQRLAT